MEKLKPSYIAGENVKHYSHSGKQFPKMLNIDLPYNSAFPLLAISPKNWKSMSTQNLYNTNVHGSIIRNGQKVTTTKMPIK